jgi:hypothetical protein
MAMGTGIFHSGFGENELPVWKDPEEVLVAVRAMGASCLRYGVVGGLDHDLADRGFKGEFVLTHQVTSFSSSF